MNKKYELKKEAITAGAKKVFHSFGYEKTTMEDIAGKLGLKKNTLYYYFKNKEDLFNYVMKEDMDEITKSVTGKISKQKTSEMKVKTFLKATSEAMFARAQFYTVSPKILLEFMIVLEHSGNVQVERFMRMLAEVLKEGVRRKEFVRHNCDEFALVLLEFIMSYNFTHLSKAVYEGITFEEMKNISCCEAILNKGIDYMVKAVKNK